MCLLEEVEEEDSIYGSGAGQFREFHIDVCGLHRPCGTGTVVVDDDDVTSDDLFDLAHWAQVVRDS